MSCNKNFSTKSIVFFSSFPFNGFDFGSYICLFGVGHLGHYDIVSIALESIILFGFGIGMKFMGQVGVASGIVLFIFFV